MNYELREFKCTQHRIIDMVIALLTLRVAHTQAAALNAASPAGASAVVPVPGLNGATLLPMYGHAPSWMVMRIE